MKNSIKVLLLLVITSLASYSLAHSGRTDAYGGHNCSEKSKQKGLCSGYHYHNNTIIEEPEQIEDEVSVAPESDHKADKQHTQDQHIHDSQES